MYSALINPVGHAWQHSKADVSLKRGLRSNRTICCDGPRRWSPLEEGKQKVEQVEQVEQKAQQLEQVIEHRMPDTQNLPPWVPTLANIALGAVLGYVIQHSIFKEAPRVVPKVKQTAREISQRVAAKTEQLTLLNAERLLLAIESMDQDTLDKLFSAADTDHNGRIDLREFAYVLAKINPDLPLAEAKDSATDFFVLFKIDPARGLDKGHFRQFLQCWALLQMEPQFKAAEEIAPALSKPTSEVIRSQQDRAIQEELDDLVRSPERLSRYVDYKKTETAFRLWDLDANGKVLREKITRSLLKLLLDKKQQRRQGAQEVLAALSFLEVEERRGRVNLDVTEFRYVVSRFCELGGLDTDEIVEGLIQLAIANEIGHGPSLKEAMEREVNEQVGPSPSRAASKSGSQKGQG